MKKKSRYFIYWHSLTGGYDQLIHDFDTEFECWNWIEEVYARMDDRFLTHYGYYFVLDNPK